MATSIKDFPCLCSILEEDGYNFHNFSIAHVTYYVKITNDVHSVYSFSSYDNQFMIEEYIVLNGKRIADFITIF